MKEHDVTVRIEDGLNLGLAASVLLGEKMGATREPVNENTLIMIQRIQKKQCCGSGSKLDPYLETLWIRISIPNTDPYRKKKYIYIQIEAKAVRLMAKIHHT